VLRHRTRSPCSHYDVILVVTSFASELATPTVTDVHTYVMCGLDTLPRLIYRDVTVQLRSCVLAVTVVPFVTGVVWLVG